MGGAVGWLRAVVVDAAEPDGNEFTVVSPLPADVARRAYGPKGTPG